MIHPTAIVQEGAKIGSGVSIGPYSVIDEGVEIGSGCHIGPQVHVTGRTRLGEGNTIHAGAVIGDAPQDLKYGGEPTGLEIGAHNTFREHVTVHRSNNNRESTRIGDHCLFMAGSHVGHNSIVGNHVIMANGSVLGGHVTVHDRVFISGNCGVHQYVTVGTLSMMQGNSGASMDVPPFCIVADINRLIGLNAVGLRRAGLSVEERNELRSTYRKIFLRTSGRLGEVMDAIEGGLQYDAARRLVAFVRASKRGVCVPDRRG